MPQSPIFKAKGLHTYFNSITEVPPGAMGEAKNVNIDADGVVIPRKGITQLKQYLTDTDLPLAMLQFKGKVLTHFSNKKIAYLDEGTNTWFEYASTVESVDDYIRVHGETAQNSLFIATKAGVQKLDTLASEFRVAGIPKGLDMTAAASAAANGFLSNNETIAYRMVWGLKDANNNISYGSPSQRVEVTSPGAGAPFKVTLTGTIPDGITASYFFQVYRSDIFASSVTPNDELRLVYERNPTASEITAKQISFDDFTPDSFKGAYLYTSGSQEGILLANEPPPIARDIANFKGFLFFGNTKNKYRQILTLTKTGGTEGIKIDTTLTIGGITYTAKGAEDINNKQFQVFTASTPAQDIASTARSLVKVINRNATSTVYAHYISNYDDLPGKILLEERGIGGSAFTIATNERTTAWTPSLTTAAPLVTATNDAFIHYVSFSKFQQPEAVPLTYNLPIGSSVFPIERILALRDSLIILKQDGIFRIVGTDPTSFSVIPLDTTAPIISADSAVVLNNQVICLTTQGVVSITDTGVSVLSRNIEDNFLRLIGVNYDNLRKKSFAIGYESDRRYILFVPSLTGSDIEHAFVYNVFTNCWTTWELVMGCGIVEPQSNTLYLGKQNIGLVYKERKTNSFRDFADDELSNSIVGQTGLIINLDNVSNVEVGDVILQISGDETKFTTIVLVDTDAISITIQDNILFSNGECSIIKGFQTSIKFLNFMSQNPHDIKQFTEVMFSFRKGLFPIAFASFASNFSTSYELVDLNGQSGIIWGLFNWGEQPWGGQPENLFPRIWVPLEKQMANAISVGFESRNAYGQFEFEGFAIRYSMGTITGSTS